ncbi:MAG: hypothetical protein QM802_19870 [Agriterribacter sp.]
MNPSCPENCLTDLPIVTVDNCNPIIVKSGINILCFAKKSADPFTDWTSPTEWSARLSNSSTNENAVRFILGTGSMPAGSKQEITYQVNKKRTISKSRTLTFTVEEANATIHNLIRMLECGGEYRFWWGTIGDRFYGGNEGVISGYDANLVLGSGENDYEQRIIELSWEDKFTPEMCTSPIAGLTDNVPVVYDTILTFVGSNEDVDQGVTGTITGTNPVTKFEFNLVNPRSGTPATLTIKVNASDYMVVDFTTDYVGRAYRFTAPNGQTFNGTFLNGTINFTTTSSS